ncbi:hypothetical protein DBA29_26595 [Xenophilus aerolatus]|nr:hypothetical protein [Xenophilus aerolatus]
MRRQGVFENVCGADQQVWRRRVEVRRLAVAVVGGGIAGLACALAAARVGADVRLYEAGAVPIDLPAHVDVVPN